MNTDKNHAPLLTPPSTHMFLKVSWSTKSKQSQIHSIFSLFSTQLFRRQQVPQTRNCASYGISRLPFVFLLTFLVYPMRRDVKIRFCELMTGASRHNRPVLPFFKPLYIRIL
jgi:hypothetical protein